MFSFTFRYSSYLYDISKRRQPITIARIVIIRCAIRTDITKVSGVVVIRGTLPPIVGAMLGFYRYIKTKSSYIVCCRIRLRR